LGLAASHSTPCRFGGEDGVEESKPLGDLTPLALPSSKRSSRRRSIAVLVVLAVAVFALLSQGLLHSLNYFDTVNEALAAKSKIGTTVIRLEGVVKPHSIHRTNRGASFELEGSSAVAVSCSGTPPQLFQANIPVVAVGHFVSTASTEFACTQIMVKHTASYIAQHPKRVKAPNGTVR
jgi:cytochrome c-type biogenesis protein CcmE